MFASPRLTTAPSSLSARETCELVRLFDKYIISGTHARTVNWFPAHALPRVPENQIAASSAEVAFGYDGGTPRNDDERAFGTRMTKNQKNVGGQDGHATLSIGALKSVDTGHASGLR
jgi:hypothetical protein